MTWDEMTRLEGAEPDWGRYNGDEDVTMYPPERFWYQEFFLAPNSYQQRCPRYYFKFFPGGVLDGTSRCQDEDFNDKWKAYRR